MQTMNYRTDITLADNKKRKEAIVFLHRYCEVAYACKDRCQSLVVNEAMLTSCVSCMNNTIFGHEGRLISQMTCQEDSGPLIEPMEYAY